MDKIKTVKIKNEDGSISEETYTISVDALNVDMANNKNLQETIGTINIDTDGNIAYQLDNLKNNKVNKTDIIDNLNSTENDKVLSANQGKILGDNINILKEKFNNSILTVNDFGAKGDGENDDTESINTAIQYCKENNITTLYFLDGEYVVSNALLINFSNFALKGSKNSVLKYVGDGTSGNIITILGTNGDNYIENITIDSIGIDGTYQIYKGGESMETPRVTSTLPAYRGLTCISPKFAKNVNIINCNINDVYGGGIICGYCYNVYINNNKLYNVGGGNISTGGPTGYDSFGDGITTFFSYNITISNNTVFNKRTYLAGMSVAIGKPCGRSGLEFEYAINQDAPANNPDRPDRNAPDYINIQTQLVGDKNYRYGVGLRMTNNYVYGYTKGIHLEGNIKFIVTGNTLLSNHIGLMLSADNYSIISENYFNPMGIGQAPQSGYDAYYGGIAVSKHVDSDRRYGIIISNNQFDGDGIGVTLGASYVTLSGNRFNSKTGVYTIKEDLTGIIINSNTFNNSLVDNNEMFMFLYHIVSIKVISNTFYGKTFSRIEISGDNIIFNENEFVNTRVFNNGGGKNLTFRDNLFKGSLYTADVLYLNSATDSLVDNNTFNITNFNSSGIYVLRLSGTSKNVNVTNNTFDVTTTRNDLKVLSLNIMENVRIINNKYLTDNDSDFIAFYSSRDCEIKNNSVSNILSRVIYFTGSFWGWNIVENNIGTIAGAGYVPNESLTRLNNSYFQKSQRIYKYGINASTTNIGWICVSGGVYTSASWTANTAYNANTILKTSNDNVYKCITKGSAESTVEPTHTTTIDVTETDGYKWHYLGPVAVLKDLPL